MVRATGLDSRANCALRSFAALTVHRTVIQYRSYFKSVASRYCVDIKMVRATGLEPAHRRYQILSLARLPVPPRPQAIHIVSHKDGKSKTLKKFFIYIISYAQMRTNSVRKKSKRTILGAFAFLAERVKRKTTFMTKHLSCSKPLQHPG